MASMYNTPAMTGYRPIDQYGVFQRAISDGVATEDSRKVAQYLTFNNLVDRPENEGDSFIA